VTIVNLEQKSVAELRADVETFLFDEAELLDTWQLDEWYRLFLPGSVYEVPTTDWTGWDAHEGSSFISDTYEILGARMKRLKSRKAHAENPHSHTHRLISNVLVTPEGDELEVKANFVLHRFRGDETEQSYVGRYFHRLRATEDGFRFLRRRSVLSHRCLRPGARLSFVL
jgi:p-cumate 2,3-dioxygenase beta subunit